MLKILINYFPEWEVLTLSSKILKLKKMIKNVLAIFAVTAIASANAQTGRIAFPPTEMGSIEQSLTYKASVTPTTVIISPLTGTAIGLNTAGSDTATPGCSPKAGYVYGSNCYDDKEKAQFFPASSYSSAVSSASLVGAIVTLFRNGTAGVGATTPNATCAVNFYAATTNSAAPGALLASSTASISSMVAAQTGTNPAYTFTFTLNTPVAISSAFYLSVTTPTAAGDTVVVLAQTGSVVPVNNTWEKWDNNSWNNMNPAWGSSFKGNMAVYPIISGTVSTVGISKQTGLNNNVSISPNPSNGIFNIAVNLNQEANVEVNVVNTLGQNVFSTRKNGVLAENLNLDLSNQSNGVYFITVTNGKDSMTKRVIISK